MAVCLKANIFLKSVSLLFAFIFNINVYAQSLTTGLNNNLRWQIDASTKLTHNIKTNQNEHAYILGLDSHKVFTSNNKDIATLTFQPYLVHKNSTHTSSSYIEHKNETELTWRIANINYHISNQGKLNIKLGHFEIPYGLEFNQDTNGTLRQYSFNERKIKADWGISLNGILPNIDYEIALTRGSGNEYLKHSDSYIFSGRFGSPSHKNTIVGGSWFYGDVYHQGKTIEQKKIAFDFAYFYRQWQVLFEVSTGKIDKNNSVNTLIELAWLNRTEELTSYVQLNQQKQKNTFWQKNNSVVVGLRWQTANNFLLSGQYHYHKNEIILFDTFDTFSLQIRYRF